MNYKLAKQLKDAGFEQKGKGKYMIFDFIYLGQEKRPIEEWEGRARPLRAFTKKYINSNEGKRLKAYYPTLSELIEACGDRFTDLWQCKYENQKNRIWRAWYYTDEISIKAFGNSPEESVAKLWLKLNGK